MRKTEFVKGDVVTFNAYHDEEIPAKVIDVKQDGRYMLEGVSKPLISITSGRSIMESSEYVKPPFQI